MLENFTKQIIIIQKFIKHCNKIYKNLNTISYNKSIINYYDINSFNISSKSNNDSNNKKREIIIGAIINNKIPNNYYKYSFRWYKLKEEVNNYIYNLCRNQNIIINTQQCIHNAGRNNNNDFKLIINNEFNFKIEFKFNAEYVIETPQFVSPMKPSQYLDIDFTEWFYNKYLPEIANYGKLEMPNKNEYLNTINNNIVSCMTKYKEKYDNDIDFNKFCKKIDKKGIKEFITISNLNITKLSNYLIKSQHKKHYMCYKNGKFYYDKLNDNLYIITQLIKKEPTNFIYLTKSGMKIEIKLRFKNGCGLQFPAFQIKRKIPYVKELKQICNKNNIKPPKMKKDIIKILDKHNIIY